MPSFAPPRRLLFGPGPTQVEPRVYQAMAQPLVGYLDPFLYEVFDQVRAGLRACFGTRNQLTIALPGTGSSGMEAAVSNFTGPGTKLAGFVNGYFSPRIAGMGRRHGATLVTLEKRCGETFTGTQTRAVLEE